jgi:hypothetical protein
MKFYLLLFTLCLLYCIPAESQVLISTRRQAFSGSNLQSANTVLQQQADSMPFKVYYIPGTWVLPPDKKQLDTVTVLSNILNGNISFPDNSSILFGTAHAQAYTKAQRFFNSLKDKDSCSLILDNIGLKHKVDGKKEYLHNYEFIFGDSIPSDIRDKIRNFIPSTVMNFNDNGLTANHQYLKEYVGFLNDSRKNVVSAGLQYPAVWPFVEVRYFDKRNLYTSERISDSLYTDIINFLQGKFPGTTYYHNPGMIDLDYELGLLILPINPYQMVKNGEFKLTVPDKGTRQWKINDHLLDSTKMTELSNPDLTKDSSFFVNGLNDVEFTGNFSTVFKNKGVRKIKAGFYFKDENLINCYISADFGNKKHKTYNIPVIIGDPNTENTLYAGDSLRLKLYEKDNGVLINNAIWKMADTTIIATEFKTVISSKLVPLTVGKDSSSMPISIKVDFEDTTRAAVVAQSDAVDIMDLAKADSIKAFGYYADALKKIKATDPGIYDICFKQLLLKVHIRPGTDPNLKSTAGGRLMGNTLSGYSIPDIGLLDVKNCEFEDGKNGDSAMAGRVIKNAMLVSKLSTTDKNSLRSSAAQQILNEKAKTLIGKIYKADPIRSERLKAEVLKGTYTQSLIDSLYYPVEMADIPTLLRFNDDTTKVYLNYTNLKADINNGNKNSLVQTFIHELMHVCYRREDAMGWLKWNIIRYKAKLYGYSLMDGLGANGHCSEGSGHEKYSPENARVCDIESHYP